MAEIAEVIDDIVEEAEFESDDDGSTITNTILLLYYNTSIFNIHNKRIQSRRGVFVLRFIRLKQYEMKLCILSYIRVRIIYYMIFRDKKTGDLLNIRRDDYINDRMYFHEIIRISGDDNVVKKQTTPRYTCSFDELQSQYNNT